VAKKVRRKSEDEEFTFEFPQFDEAGFVWKEYELTSATVLAGLFALGLGLVCWVLSAVSLSVWVPLGIGIAAVIASVWAIRALRPASELYTKGDWAGLLALEFFGWLALWFLLLNIAPNLGG
jgi:hypothetical protein